MSADDIGGDRMDRTAAERFLEAQGHGVLSLVDGTDAYAIPVSFGYDPDRGLFLYLLEFEDGGRKFECIEATERACLTTYAVAGKGDWESVVVTGPLAEFDTEGRTTTEVTDLAVIREVMEDSAWFPTFDVPEEQLTGQRIFLLQPEEITGRKGREA
jgi:nitroimidazol reductase NimA-like FMN-containing flavoprotein (pyridoxamine 5'-phosphate oxidase superfamily)